MYYHHSAVLAPLRLLHLIQQEVQELKIVLLEVSGQTVLTRTLDYFNEAFAVRVFHDLGFPLQVLDFVAGGAVEIFVNVLAEDGAGVSGSLCLSLLGLDFLLVIQLLLDGHVVVFLDVDQLA